MKKIKKDKCEHFFGHLPIKNRIATCLKCEESYFVDTAYELLELQTKVQVLEKELEQRRSA